MVKPKIDNETKEEKFRRIAAKRTQVVLDRLRVLGNCANKSIYSYSDAQVEQMFREIEDELSKIKHKFGAKQKKFEFKL